jgi:hypothetical protein
MTLVRVTAVEPLDAHTVRLTFTDGVVKTMDLAPLMRGPVFAPLLREPALFSAIRVDPELGTVVWPGGADLDPDVLYGDRTPAWSDAEKCAANR